MKRLLITAFIFISTTLFSQNITIEKSDIIKEKTRFVNLIFSENDGNGGLIVLKRASLKTYAIEHYNEKLELLKTTTLKYDKRSYFRDILIKDGVVNLFQFKSNKKSKDISVNILSADIDKLVFKSKTLFTLDREKFKKYFSFNISLFLVNNGTSEKDKDSYGMVTFSNLKKYFVLSFDIKNKTKEEHLFLVYDNEFNKVFEKTFKSNIEDRFFDFKDITVSDEDGTIFLLGKVFENNSTKLKKNKKTNYHYELYKIYGENQQLISIKQEALFIGSLYLLNKKNRLVLVGFYSEKNDYRYKGVCRINLDSKLNIKNKSFQPFSKQFFEDKYKAGDKVRKNKKELRNLEYRSVFFDENDNIIINAEEFFENSYYVSNPDGMGGHWVTTSYFGDVISTKMNPKGELVWARNINKSQRGFLTSSFTAILVNGKNYIFLNISDKIKKLSNNRISFVGTSAKRSNLYVIVIDEKGDVTYKKLIDDKDSKVWYSVSDGEIDVQDQSVIFQGEKRRYKQIIKLKVE